jgi:cytochrome d ubiquinol oxidase subunit I
MLFGWNRVGRPMHFAATVIVAIGTLVSAFWILASNSWMHTPQGHAIVDGRVVPVDWLQIIFNPSFPYRLLHMVTAAYLATALMVGAAGAWHLLRGRDDAMVRTMLSMAMWMVLCTAPVQAVIGDLHGLNTLEHQPAKIAAIEGHWEQAPGEAAPLILFGWPDMAAEQTRYALAIPKLGSVILTHSLDGRVPALKDFAPADRPNATVVFWTFRVMVGLGLLMIALGFLAAFLRWRRRLYVSRPFLRFALAMGPAGLVAMLAGWYTTEIGRQPWIVHGLMRTAEGVSPHAGSQVGLTLLVFVVAYLLVFGAGTFYALRLIAAGPRAEDVPATPQGGAGQPRQPMRPMSAADRPGEPESA